MQLKGWNKAFTAKEKYPSNRRADALQKYLMFKSMGGFCRLLRAASRPIDVGAAGASV
ncbi:hypothetical protein F475_02087 [Pseudomonas sp. URMO17WK12:I6]|jgi:hypothetical protein|nr:hypothetical protein F475_02087 [Pseudomonas sp. URMO17WK12:I6]